MNTPHTRKGDATAWTIGEEAARGKPALRKFGSKSVQRPVSEGIATAELLGAGS